MSNMSSIDVDFFFSLDMSHNVNTPSVSVSVLSSKAAHQVRDQNAPVTEHAAPASLDSDPASNTQNFFLRQVLPYTSSSFSITTPCTDSLLLSLSHAHSMRASSSRVPRGFGASVAEEASCLSAGSSNSFFPHAALAHLFQTQNRAAAAATTL